MKSLYRVPTPITTSASRASAFAAGVPVAPTPPTASGWSHGSAPLPAWVSATGMPVASAKRAQRVAGLAVEDPAAGDDQRPLGGADDLGGPRAQRAGSGTGRATCQTRSREELVRPVVRLGLHVLRQGDGDRAGLGRVGEHPHRGEQRGRAAARAG